MSKTALITGITGQDGRYLAELLLEKNYVIHGLKRRTSLFNTARIDHLIKDPHMHKSKFFLHHGDLSDGLSITKLIRDIEPDEIYNLGAMSHVHVSFEIPEYSANIDGVGTLRILEALRVLGMEKKVKLYQASTSELYGKCLECPQNELTPFYPRSPYGVAKLYAYWITVNYREAYNMFACNGILFNHESPVRGETFVTRKITLGIAKIIFGKESRICLGNLEAKRDWGDARDFVQAMWLMLQQDEPEDYVIATGKTHSIKEFAKKAFEIVGISIKFSGTGIEEKGIIDEINMDILSKINESEDIPKIGQIVIEVDPFYFRPTEVELLQGDASKAKANLNWEAKISFAEMIKDMVENDIELIRTS